MSNLNEKQTKFKDQILSMEKENIANISKADDKQMVAKIIRVFEETKKNDNK